MLLELSDGRQVQGMTSFTFSLNPTHCSAGVVGYFQYFNSAIDAEGRVLLICKCDTSKVFIQKKKGSWWEYIGLDVKEAVMKIAVCELMDIS